MRKLEALYFPYASVRDSGVLKSALLYFDRLWVLSSETALGETEGEFGELLRDQELVQWINGEALANNNAEILLDAIQTDLSDSDFIALASRASPWEIYADKGIYVVESLVQPIGSRGNKVLVPYQQGEAFLLNLALLATTTGSHRLIPFADDEQHLTILRHKLRRGAKGQLERLYGETLEKREIEALVSAIGHEAVESVLPAPEEARDIPIERIKQFRQEYQEERNKLWDAIFSTIEGILREEEDISPARLKIRIQTLLDVELRQLQQEAAWRTRILDGIKTTLGVLEKTVERVFQAALAGVPFELGLASQAPSAGSAVLGFVDRQTSIFRTSDVTYLYLVRKKFGS